MSTTINYKHASLMRRLFAALLDGVVIGLFGTVLGVGAYLPLMAELIHQEKASPS